MDTAFFRRLFSTVAALAAIISAVAPATATAHEGHAGIPSDVVSVLITNLAPFQVALPRPAVAVPARTTNGYCVPVYPGLCFTNPIAVYDMPMQATSNQFHPGLPPIEVWGYDGRYPGPTIEAQVGVPILVNWINQLTNHDGEYPFWLQADPRLFHDAGGSGLDPQTIRTVVHLHGAAVLPRYDGYPTNWFTAGQSDQYFYGNLDLNGDGETLWYHDHAIGVTGNNVYAGLAGFYLLRAPGYDKTNGIALPSGPYEVPLVFQDRDFAVSSWTNNGVAGISTNLFSSGTIQAWAYVTNVVTNATPFSVVTNVVLTNYITTSGLPWHHHAVVNGKVTPYLEVEPRPYRFRILNGAGFRTFALTLTFATNGVAITNAVVVSTVDGSKITNQLPTFTVVGTEDGYLPAPATGQKRLSMMPGERIDALIDFSGLKNLPANYQVNVQNGFGSGSSNGDVPFAPFVTNLMQFRVTLPLTNGGGAVNVPTNLVPDWVATSNLVAKATVRRTVTLDLSQETPFPGLPFDEHDLSYPFALLNMKHFESPISEFPHAGDIEVWEVANLSNEAHPLHVHLLDFRVIDRQRFASDLTSRTTPWNGNLATPPAMVSKYIEDRKAGQTAALSSYLSLTNTDILPAAPFESGPKDVVRCAPFAVTRIVMQWPTNAMFYQAPSGKDGTDAPGRYIFHCHILDHEDNDMMRPLQLVAPWQPEPLFLFADQSSPESFELFYPHRPNQKYVLEATEDLEGGVWSPIAPGTGGVRHPVLHQGASLWIQELTSSQVRRFYRVRAVPPTF